MEREKRNICFALISRLAGQKGNENLSSNQNFWIPFHLQKRLQVQLTQVFYCSDPRPEGLRLWTTLASL